MVFLFFFMHHIKHNDQSVLFLYFSLKSEGCAVEGLFQVLGLFANMFCTEDVVMRHAGLKCQSNEATDLWMNV